MNYVYCFKRGLNLNKGNFCLLHTDGLIWVTLLMEHVWYDGIGYTFNMIDDINFLVLPWHNFAGPLHLVIIVIIINKK